jgi:hypothetical protein
MGNSSDRSTSNTTTTSNQTTTPVILNPALSGGLTGYLDRLNNFSENTNARDLVAGSNSYQNAALDQALALNNGGVWQNFLNEGRDLANKAGNAKAPTAAVSTYNPVANVKGQTYSAATYNPLANLKASTYDAALAKSQGYTAAQLAKAAQVANAQQATAQNGTAQSLLTNLQSYYNPYEDQVVDAYRDDFDQTAGVTRASQAAQAARNGAFSGSRYGVQEAQTEDALSRARASGLASILQQGFDRATSLSEADAARRQATDLFNAQNQTQNSQFNANEANDVAQLRAQLEQQGLLANLAATNDSRAFTASAANNAALANAAAQNAAGQFNANSRNAIGLANQAATNDAYQFNANSRNQAGQYNASSLQQALLANQAASNAAAQFNAAARNSGAQFNAAQQADQLSRQLQSAGILGSLGSQRFNNQLAANQNLANQGQSRYNIDQAQATAELSLLQSLGSLYNAYPGQYFVGQNANGTQNTTGTTTVTSNPGLLGSLNQIGGLLSLGNPLAGLFAGGAKSGSASQSLRG